VKRRLWIFIGLGLVVSLLLAGVVSYYASSSPDGLEKVAGDVGFGDAAKDSAVAGSPLTDYGVQGVSDQRVSVGLAGIIGVVVVAVVAFGLFLWLGRRNSRTDEPADADVSA
jgi:cobalt/nickel transport protein